jgi:sugar phosphate isomerase/epimerase
VLALWAGAAQDGSVGDRRDGKRASEELWRRLCDGLRPVLARGHAQGVQIAFEPEPGMFIERPAGYVELVERLGADGEELGLCLDLGHCHVTRDLPVADVIRQCAPRLVLVQLDDCKDGEHVHRMFGEGDLDLPAALDALLEVGFDGVAAVELSRDSHRGPEAARKALECLCRALASR